MSMHAASTCAMCSLAVHADKTPTKRSTSHMKAAHIRLLRVCAEADVTKSGCWSRMRCGASLRRNHQHGGNRILGRHRRSQVDAARRLTGACNRAVTDDRTVDIATERRCSSRLTAKRERDCPILSLRGMRGGVNSSVDRWR